MVKEINRRDKNNRYVETTKIIENNSSFLTIHNILQQVVATVSVIKY
jgi:hypothetical protein